MFEYDLHLHSTSSDGLLSPTELVNLAKEQGLKGLALTDHDNINGLEEAASQAAKMGLDFIYGVELSTQMPRRSGDIIKVHLLGYFKNLPSGLLLSELDKQLQMRRSRALKIGQKLAALGCSLDLDSLLEEHKDGHIGRPHFAQAMVQAGFVTSKQEAFDRYLHDGGSAYVPYQDPMNTFEAIKLVAGCNGYPVIAHPGEYGLGAIDSELSTLMACGLVGIECSHPRNNNETQHHYRTICADYHLVSTGGTDFHGPVQKGQALPGKYGCFSEDIDKLFS